MLLQSMLRDRDSAVLEVKIAMKSFAAYLTTCEGNECHSVGVNSSAHKTWLWPGTRRLVKTRGLCSQLLL